MLSADAQAARLMADRSLGQIAQPVHTSRLFMGTLGQFQLEVANNLKWMKDITRTCNSPGRAAAILTLLAVRSSKLTNEAWKQLTGRESDAGPDKRRARQGISAGREAADEGGAWKAAMGGPQRGVGRGRDQRQSALYKRRAHRHEPDKRRDRRGGHDKGRGGGRQQRAGVGHGVLADDELHNLTAGR